MSSVIDNRTRFISHMLRFGFSEGRKTPVIFPGFVERLLRGGDSRPATRRRSIGRILTDVLRARASTPAQSRDRGFTGSRHQLNQSVTFSNPQGSINQRETALLRGEHLLSYVEAVHHIR